MEIDQPLELPSDITNLQKDIELKNNEFQHAYEEAFRFYSKAEEERVKGPAIKQWMFNLQNLLWPDHSSSSLDEINSFFDDSTDSHSVESRETGNDSLVERTQAILRKISNNTTDGIPIKLLPKGLQDLYRIASNELGISHVEDVAICIDAFRWMNWIRLCLELLRFPPTTSSLKTLLDLCKDLRCTDDHILRLLGGILNRAM